MRYALLTLLAAAFATPGIAQISWHNQSSPGVTDNIFSVTYANDTFAAVTDQGNLLTSGDGLTWASLSIAKGLPLSSIVYGNDGWVVVGAGGNIFTSADLRSWTPASSPTTDNLNYVAYFQHGDIGAYIAVGNGGTILVSSDGLSWSDQPSGVTASLFGVTAYPPYIPDEVCGQGGILLSSQLYTGGPGFDLAPAVTSQDLYANYAQIDSTVIDIQVGAAGTILNDNQLASVNGPAVTSALRAITFGGETFVTVGDLGTILTSTDGRNWTQRFSGDSPASLSTASLRGAAYSEDLQRFVAVGSGGTILVSDAPPIVLVNVSTRGVVGNTQPLIGGFVVQGPYGRKVLIRADGPTLAQFGVTNALPDPVLTVYDNQGNLVDRDIGWTTDGSAASIPLAASRVGAFALPSSSKDSAAVLGLNPGAYTVVITSASGSSGTALFEAYIY